MNEEYEAEFERCEEMDALARSNRARAGSPAKDKPKSTGLKRTTPLRAKTGLQTKTPLQAHAIAPAGQGGEFDAERQTSRDSSSDHTWNGLKRTPLKTKTGLKARSTLKPARKQRHYGHLVKNGWCAVCGEAGVTHWHHIIARSHGGDEADENMIEVCPECHRKIHAYLISQDEVIYRYRLTAGSYLKENQRTTTYGTRA